MIHFISGQASIGGGSAGIQHASLDDALKYCMDKEILGVDTETQGQFDHDNSMIMFQIGDEDHQYVIDTRSVDISDFRIILEDPNITKIFWNAKFDLKFIKKDLGVETEGVYDGFLREKALYNGLDRDLSLGAAVWNYMGEQLDKTHRGQFSNKGSTPFDDREILYGAKDVKYLIDIRRQQLEKMEEWGMLREGRLEDRYICVHADMEYYGMNIDVDKWLELESEKHQEYNEAIERLERYVIDNDHKSFINGQQDLFSGEVSSTIKWTSAPQVAEYCKYLGMDILVDDPKTGGKKESTGNDVILKNKDEHPEFVELLLDFREKKKQVESYGREFLYHVNKRTGRIHSDFFPFINTGRLSSSSPNLQNIPNEDVDPRYRRCFIPKEGHKLVVLDYSQQEPRITADRSGDQKLIEFFRSGSGDTHSLVASIISPLIYGEHVDVKKGENDPHISSLNMSLRAVGKQTNLGLDYGKSAYTLKDDLDCSEELAQQIMDRIKEKLPGKEEYFKSKHKEALNKGYITIDNITGRKFFIKDMERLSELKSYIDQQGFWDDYRREKSRDSERFRKELKPIVKEYFSTKGAIERDAQNYPIQGTGASMIKWASVMIRDHLKQEDLWGDQARIICILHDEIVIECEERLSQYIADLAEKKMIESGRTFCQSVDMKVDPVITDHWTH